MNLEAWLERAQLHWAKLASFAALLIGGVGRIVSLPPALNVDQTSWTATVLLSTTVLIGLVFVFGIDGKRISPRKWGAASGTLLAATLVLQIVYQNAVETRMERKGDNLVVIGTNFKPWVEPTLRKKYDDHRKPRPSRRQLLWETTREDIIWPAEEIAANRLFLSVLYLAVTLLAVSTALALIQALDKAAHLEDARKEKQA